MREAEKDGADKEDDGVGSRSASLPRSPRPPAAPSVQSKGWQAVKRYVYHNSIPRRSPGRDPALHGRMACTNGKMREALALPYVCFVPGCAFSKVGPREYGSRALQLLALTAVAPDTLSRPRVGNAARTGI